MNGVLAETVINSLQLLDRIVISPSSAAAGSPLGEYWMYSVTRIFAPNKLEDPVWASSTIATLCGESISNKSLNAGWEDVDMFSDRA